MFDPKTGKYLGNLGKSPFETDKSVFTKALERQREAPQRPKHELTYRPRRQKTPAELTAERIAARLEEAKPEHLRGGLAYGGGFLLHGNDRERIEANATPEELKVLSTWREQREAQRRPFEETRPPAEGEGIPNLLA